MLGSGSNNSNVMEISDQLNFWTTFNFLYANKPATIPHHQKNGICVVAKGILIFRRKEIKVGDVKNDALHAHVPARALMRTHVPPLPLTCRPAWDSSNFSHLRVIKFRRNFPDAARQNIFFETARVAQRVILPSFFAFLFGRGFFIASLKIFNIGEIRGGTNGGSILIPINHLLLHIEGFL